MEGMIRINNRDEMEWEEGLTVLVLLERLRHFLPHVLVVVNGKVVPVQEYATYVIPDGADVRLGHSIAGG